MTDLPHRVISKQGLAGTVVDPPEGEPVPEGMAYVWFDYQASKDHAKPVPLDELRPLPK